MQACSHFENLSKLRDVDLKVLIQYLNKNFDYKMQKSDNKKTKMTKLSEALGFTEVATSDEVIARTQRRKIKPLRGLALNVLSNKIPKNVLNISIVSLSGLSVSSVGKISTHG